MTPDEAEEEFQDFIRMRGDVLEGVKNEFDQFRGLITNLHANALAKERDYASKQSELNLTRDQIVGCKRVVEDSVTAQESLDNQMNTLGEKSKKFSSTEQSDRREISNVEYNRQDLLKGLEVGADWRPDQLEQKSILEKERDFLEQKLETKQNEFSTLRTEVERGYETIVTAEKSIEEVDEEIKVLNNNVEVVEKQIRDAIRAREKKEKNIAEVRQKIVDAENDLAARRRIYKTEDTALKDLDSSLNSAKELMEGYIREFEGLNRTYKDMVNQLDKEKSAQFKVREEIEEVKKYNDLRGGEVKVVKKELKQIAKLKEVVNEKCDEAEKERVIAEAKREKLETSIDQLENVETKNLRKEIEGLNKVIAHHKRELDVLDKKYGGSEKATKALLDLIQMNQNGKKNLLVERKTLEDEVKSEQIQIEQLVKEKEKYEHEAELANQKYYTSLEELKLQDLQIKELQRKVIDDQARLKQKQNLYDAVRSDRNLYSKQLTSSQEEIGILRRNFKSMTVHIEQLKEEISTKDHAIVKEHFHHHSVDKERELLKNEITKIRKQVQSSENIIEAQQTELLKLSRIIDEADLERQRQNSELSNVVSERNLLTAQVVKRNFELTQMYEKIKVSRSTLYIGERNYVQLMESLAAYQAQLKVLVVEQNSTITALAGIDEMKNKVAQLTKDLRLEHVKERALADEMERPMNVHRWRILESSDPQRFDKIRQIQDLQKLLMTKTDRVTETDLLVQEKEKIYMELKNIIARQPGPETEDQILTYQQTLKAKVKQLNALRDELDMYREQVSKFKDDIVDADERMTGIKKKWFSMKRKEGERQ